MDLKRKCKAIWRCLLNLRCLFKLPKRNTSIIASTLLIVVFFYCVLLHVSHSHSDVNKYQNKRFYRRNHNVKFQLANFWSVIQLVFTKYNIKYTTNIQDADIYWYHFRPCSLRSLNHTLQDLADTNKKLTLFGAVEGCHQISRKQFVWNVSENVYGRDIAKRMIPETFRLNDDEDMKLFEQNYESNKMYILKQELHGQRGLKLSSDKDYIINEAHNDGYVLAQEYMTNPYLLNGRKIHLRIYSVIKCNENEAEGYLYNHGQVYYTNQTFDAESHSSDAHLTQYTSHVETLPMHTNELGEFMDINDYNQVNDQIFDISKAVFEASKHLFCGSEEFKDYNRLHLFGADFIFDENLHVYLLEINSDPALSDSAGLSKQIKAKYDHWEQILFENYLKLAQDKAFGKDHFEFRSL